MRNTHAAALLLATGLLAACGGGTPETPETNGADTSYEKNFNNPVTNQSLETFPNNSASNVGGDLESPTTTDEAGPETEMLDQR